MIRRDHLQNMSGYEKFVSVQRSESACCGVGSGKPFFHTVSCSFCHAFLTLLLFLVKTGPMGSLSLVCWSAPWASGAKNAGWASHMEQGCKQHPSVSFRFPAWVPALTSLSDGLWCPSLVTVFYPCIRNPAIPGLPCCDYELVPPYLTHTHAPMPTDVCS